MARFNPIHIRKEDIPAIIGAGLTNSSRSVAVDLDIPATNFSPQTTQYADFVDIWDALKDPYRKSFAAFDAEVERINQQIREIYEGIVPATRSDRTDMLALTALRADAFLQADPSIVDKDFILEAIKYNPKVYALLPDEYSRNPDVVNAYCDARYAGKGQTHPIFEELKEYPRAPGQYVSHAPSEQLFSPRNYENVFREIYEHQAAHKESRSGNFSEQVEFIAHARNWAEHNAPQLLEEFDQKEKLVAQQSIDIVATQAQESYSGYIRTNLEEFGKTHNINFPLEQWREADFIKRELEDLRMQATNRDNTTEELISTVYAVGEALEHHGFDAVNKYFDVEDFYKHVGTTAAELDARSIMENKPELKKQAEELKQDISWDREWKHVGKNICAGYDEKLKEFPGVTIDEKGQIIPVVAKTPETPIAAQNTDASVLVLKREGIFEHFNPMAMTPEQIDIIGQAQMEHNKSYTPLKPLEIGPPPKDKTKIVDIVVAAEALRNAKGDKETAEVLSRLGHRIRNNSLHMIELMKINPQAYNAASYFVRHLEPFVKTAAVEASPRVYDFLSQREQKNPYMMFAYRNGLMKDTSYLNKMQGVLEQVPNGTNNLYVPLYDKHPNCSNLYFYSPYHHQTQYEKICTQRDAILNPFLLNKNLPVSPLHFEGARDFEGLTSGNRVRNVIVPNKGLILGPDNISLCASLVHNPDKRLTRIASEQGILKNLASYLAMEAMFGPALSTTPSNDAPKTSYPEFPLAFNASREGAQWRKEFREAFEVKAKDKLQTKIVNRCLNHCEHKGKIKMCKDIKHFLRVPEQAQRRLDFAHADAVAVEVYPVKPQEMLKAMFVAGPEMLNKYVSPQTQSDYWRVWAQEITEQKLAQSHSPHGVHPSVEQHSIILEKAAQKYPSIAPDIQLGIARAQHNAEMAQNIHEQTQTTSKLGFFHGAEAYTAPKHTTTFNDMSKEEQGRTFDGRS